MSSSRENNAAFFFVCRATRLCAVTASALGNRFAMSTKRQNRRSIEKTKAVNEAGIGGWEPETSTVLSLDFFDWKELERRNYRNMSDQVKGFDVVGPELAEKETKQLEDLINWSSLLLDREEIVRCIEREAGGVLLSIFFSACVLMSVISSLAVVSRLRTPACLSDAAFHQNDNHPFSLKLIAGLRPSSDPNKTQ